MTAAILKWALFYSTTAKRRKTWYTKKASLHSIYLIYLLLVYYFRLINCLLKFWINISIDPKFHFVLEIRGGGHHVKQGNSIFFLQLTLYV